jgi:hypothetical protein
VGVLAYAVMRGIISLIHPLLGCDARRLCAIEHTRVSSDSVVATDLSILVNIAYSPLSIPSLLAIEHTRVHTNGGRLLTGVSAATPVRVSLLNTRGACASSTRCVHMLHALASFSHSGMFAMCPLQSILCLFAARLHWTTRREVLHLCAR